MSLTQNILFITIFSHFAQGSNKGVNSYYEPPYHHRFKSRLPKEYVVLSSEEIPNTFNDEKLLEPSIPTLISFSQSSLDESEQNQQEIRRSPQRITPPQAKIPPTWKRSFTELAIQPIALTKKLVLESLDSNQSLPILQAIPSNTRFIRSKNLSITKILAAAKSKEFGANTIVEKHRSEGPLPKRKRKYKKRSAKRLWKKKIKKQHAENPPVIPRRPPPLSRRFPKEFKYKAKNSKNLSDSRQKIPSLPLRPIPNEINERRTVLEFEIDKLNEELKSIENRLKETDESTEQSIGDRIELNEQRELKKKYQQAIEELTESTSRPFMEPTTISDNGTWNPLKYYVKDGIVYERMQGRRVAGVSTQDRAIPVISREGNFIGPKSRVESSPLVAEIQWETSNEENSGYAKRIGNLNSESIFNKQQRGFMFPIGLNYPPIPIPTASFYKGAITSSTFSPTTTDTQRLYSFLVEPFPLPGNFIRPRAPLFPPIAPSISHISDQQQNRFDENDAQKDIYNGTQIDKRSSSLNGNFPSQSCYTNRDGYMCCNERLEMIMRKSFSKLRRRLGDHGCTVQLIANQIQKDAEVMFGLPFETVVGGADFALRAHFVADLTCKIEQDGRFVTAYATATPENGKIEFPQRIVYDPRELVTLSPEIQPINENVLNQFIEERSVAQRTTLHIPDTSTLSDLNLLPFGTLQTEDGSNSKETNTSQSKFTTVRTTAKDEPRLTFSLKTPFKDFNDASLDQISTPKYSTNQELFPLPHRTQMGVKTVSVGKPIDFSQ
ncbi:unnamed protein product, partial [Mesorhabditis belari]|uniref:Ground-like domain-containing protein n=1 Tax=Mesorhabditis belari TaxID=2138241 RepID=A0AAF3EYL8_9BILA